MGFSLTTLQITGKSRERIFSELALKPSGTIWTDPQVETICGCARPDGAYLIVAMNDMGRHAEPMLLEALSREADVLVCQVHEGCMWSQIGHWHDGKRSWSVEHVSEEGLHHLDVVGAPPLQFAAIRQAREARQASEGHRRFGADHIFDIAPALYAELAGYRYDRIDPAARYEELISS